MNINLDTVPPLHRYTIQNLPKKVKKELKKTKSDFTDRFGRTALHYACLSGNEEIVTMLLKAKAQIIQDEDGENQMHCAAKRGHLSVLNLLFDQTRLTGLDVHPEHRTVVDRSTILHLFVRSCYPARSGSTPQQEKEFNQQLITFTTLFKKLVLLSGISPNVQDQHGQTPLHIACSLSDHYHQCVLLLLAQGSDPNITDKDGHTALHYACRAGHDLLVQDLVSSGAQIDLKGQSGTPSEIADQQGHKSIVRYLEETVESGTAAEITERLQRSKSIGPSGGRSALSGGAAAEKPNLAKNNTMSSAPKELGNKPKKKGHRRVKSILGTSKTTKDSVEHKGGSVSHIEHKGKKVDLISSGAVSARDTDRSRSQEEPGSKTARFAEVPQKKGSSPVSPRSHGSMSGESSLGKSSGGSAAAVPRSANEKNQRIESVFEAWASNSEQSEEPLMVVSSPPSARGDKRSLTVPELKGSPSGSLTPSPAHSPRGEENKDKSSPGALAQRDKAERSLKRPVSVSNMTSTSPRESFSSSRSSTVGTGLSASNSVPNVRSTQSEGNTRPGSRSMSPMTDMSSSYTSSHCPSPPMESMSPRSTLAIVSTVEILKLEPYLRLLDNEDPMKHWKYFVFKNFYANATLFAKPAQVMYDRSLDTATLLYPKLNAPWATPEVQQSLRSISVNAAILSLFRRRSISYGNEVLPATYHPMFRSYSFKGLQLGLKAMRDFSSLPPNVLDPSNLNREPSKSILKAIASVMLDICCVCHRLGWIDSLRDCFLPLLWLNDQGDCCLDNVVMTHLRAVVEHWMEFSSCLDTLKNISVKKGVQHIRNPPITVIKGKDDSAQLNTVPPPFVLNSTNVNHVLSETSRQVHLKKQPDYGGALQANVTKRTDERLLAFNGADANSEKGTMSHPISRALSLFIQTLSISFDKMNEFEGDRMMNDVVDLPFLSTDELTHLVWMVRTKDPVLAMHATRVFEIALSLVSEGEPSSPSGFDNLIVGLVPVCFTADKTLHIFQKEMESAVAITAEEVSNAKNSLVEMIFHYQEGEIGKTLLVLAYKEASLKKVPTFYKSVSATRSLCQLLRWKEAAKDSSNAHLQAKKDEFIERHGQLCVQTALSNILSSDSQVAYHSILSVGALMEYKALRQHLNLKYPGYIWKAINHVLENVKESVSLSFSHLLLAWSWVLLQLTGDCDENDIIILLRSNCVAVALKLYHTLESLWKRREERLSTISTASTTAQKGDDVLDAEVEGGLVTIILHHKTLVLGHTLKIISNIARQCPRLEVRQLLVQKDTLSFLLEMISLVANDETVNEELGSAANSSLAYIFDGMSQQLVANLLAKAQCPGLGPMIISIIQTKKVSAEGLYNRGPSPLQYKVHSLLYAGELEYSRASVRLQQKKFARACKMFQSATRRLSIVLEWYPQHSESKHLLFHCHFAKANAQKSIGALPKYQGTQHEIVALEAARVNYTMASRYHPTDPFTFHQLGICAVQLATILSRTKGQQEGNRVRTLFQTAMQCFQNAVKCSNTKDSSTASLGKFNHSQTDVYLLKLAILLNWGLGLQRWAAQLQRVAESSSPDPDTIGTKFKPYAHSAMKLCDLSDERLQAAIRFEPKQVPCYVALGLSSWRRGVLCRRLNEKTMVSHFKKGITWLSKALEIDGKNLQALYNSALVRLDLARVYRKLSSVPNENTEDELLKLAVTTLKDSMEFLKKISSLHPNLPLNTKLIDEVNREMISLPRP